MSRTRSAVLVGFVVRSPVAGMAFYNLHYVAGLRELGYDVHYVEHLNAPNECYDPELDEFGDDPTYGLEWLHDAYRRLPPLATSSTVIDRTGRYHGLTRPKLCRVLDQADFVLTLADPTWFDDLGRCRQRAFLDGDPLFTQVRMLDPSSRTSAVMERYPTLFTYWTRQGAQDTTVPSAGREWISTRPAVATALWRPKPPQHDAPVTTVMNWGAWGDVEFGGRTYGHKNREFEKLIELPSRTTHSLVVAVGGPAPKEILAAAGWALANPLEVTRDLQAYQQFIDHSFADLGIAKHAYVASRSGWFSDRSTCYLASGRPVLHQDTGFTDWLPTGNGVFAFSNVDDLLAALDALDRDYESHAKAAREIAEEYFEARTVIGRMLDAAGFR